MKKIKMIIRNFDPLYRVYSKYIEKKYKKKYEKAVKSDSLLKLLDNNYYKKTGNRLSNPPKTYTEKIQYSKLFALSPEKTLLSDKYMVREWVKKKIGDKYLIPLLGVWNNFEEIDFSSLPDKFVLKTNHASGTNVIVKSKKDINLKKLKKKFNFWLHQNFAFAGKGYEMHYSNIKPKIICEKYVVDKKGELNDYKFLCFNGKPYYCWVDIDRNTNHKRNVYDMNWQLQEWNQFFPNSNRNVSKPENFDEMVRVVKALSEGFPHVRVDLYNVDGKIYFGEMTFTNGKGYERIYPEKYDEELGKLWKEDFNITKK